MTLKVTQGHQSLFCCVNFGRGPCMRKRHLFAKNDLYDLLLMVSSYSVGMWPTKVSVTLRSPLVLNQLNKAVTVPDLSMWRPWAGSLLEAPTHPQML